MRIKAKKIKPIGAENLSSVRIKMQVYVDAPVFDKIEKRARENERRVTQEVRYILNEYFRNNS